MGTNMSSREEADWLVDNLHTIFFSFQSVPQRPTFGNYFMPLFSIEST